MKNVTKLRRYGFLTRMSTKKGRQSINRKRAKGRSRISL